MTQGDDKRSDASDENQAPADGPSSGGAGEESSETGTSSQDKPGGTGGTGGTDGKQSPN